MDFEDSPEEAAFRAEVRAWLSANAEPKRATDVPQVFLSEALDVETVRAAQAWQRRKAEAGWACLRWPKAYGGREATPIQSVIWGQEESRFQIPPDVFGIGIGMCGPTLLTHGTDEQKQRWIPKLLSGEEIWCQLFSEPSAGSDLAGLRTSARREEGGDWIVDGQKIWTTGAHYCRWGVLVARHDFEATKHAGLTYFVVDMQAPGIEIRPIRQMNGGSAFNEVFFSGVRVPDTNRIGTVGDGWRVAITTLMNERAAASAGGGSGTMQQLFELARATHRRGRPSIEDGAVRERLAEFWVRSTGVKYTGYRTLTALSRGRVPGPEASLGKLATVAMAQRMAAFAMELSGPAGAVMEPRAFGPHGAAWQELWLGIPGFRIAGGSDEILRNIIAERVLGLPPEARADKGMAFHEIPSGPR